MIFAPFQLLLGACGYESTLFPMIVGVFISNTLYAGAWMYGGPILMSYSLVSFVFNQRLYNALLFRRSFEGFVISFILGNFCIGEVKEIVQVVPEPEYIVEPEQKRDVEVDENPLRKKRSWATKVKKTARWISTKAKARLTVRKARGNPYPVTEPNLKDVPKIGDVDDIEMGTLRVGNYMVDFEKDCIVQCDEEGATEAIPMANVSPLNPQPTTYDFSNKQSPRANSNSNIESAGKDLHIFIPPLPVTYQDRGANDVVTEHDDTVDVTFESAKNASHDEQIDRTTRVVDHESVNSPLGIPSDVFIEKNGTSTVVENHPGTVAWKNLIRDAVVKYRGSDFVDLHYSWIMTQLGQRDFFIGSQETGWTPMTPTQIREACMEAYTMELTSNTEIKMILKGFKELKHKRMTRSKSPKKTTQTQRKEMKDSEEIKPCESMATDKQNSINSTKVDPMERISKANSKNKEEEELLDESIEIADIVNVKSYLRKASKDRNSKKLSVDQANPGDRFGATNSAVAPVDESVEITDVLDVECSSRTKLTRRGGKGNFTVSSSKNLAETADLSAMNIDEQPMESEMGNESLQHSKRKGGVFLAKVFKRSEANEKEATQKDELERTHSRQQDHVNNEIPKHSKVQESKLESSTKRVLDAIDGVLRSSETGSKPTETPTSIPTEENSVVMWTETESMHESGNTTNEEAHGRNKARMDGTTGYFGEMFRLDTRKHQNIGNINTTTIDTNYAVDSRDILATELQSRDGSRDGDEQQDEISELPFKQTPSHGMSLTKRLGLKNLLPRKGTNKKSLIIDKLDEVSKNDPELVKNWIAQQTSALRNRSKVLRSVWTKALKRRQKTLERKKTGDDNKLTNDELNDFEFWNEEHSIDLNRKATPSIQILFDAKSLEQEEAIRKQKEATGRDEKGDSNKAQNDGVGEMFRDQVVGVWLEEYMKATPTLKHINALADDVSAADLSTVDSTASSITTSASLISRVPPRSLLEFVEQKIEEEILYSRVCVGDSVYSGIQCDAGLTYLRENDSSGFFSGFLDSVFPGAGDDVTINTIQ